MLFEYDTYDHRTIREIEQDNYIPYQLEYYERESIEEIKRSIDDHQINRKLIKDYLEFLDHLLAKFRTLRNEECAVGNPVKDIDDILKELKMLSDRLSLLYTSS